MKRKNILKKMSILPQGLRYKLLIAFSLMSVIPLLIIGYLVSSFILVGQELTLAHVSALVLFCIVIAWLGLFLSRSIIDRVVDMAIETRAISEGNYENKVFVDTGDEIGQIGETVNFLTKKIRSNISDLKDYQEKMKDINVDIQKKVSVLSNLLQIGQLISSSVKIDSIFDLALGKLAQFHEDGFAALYFLAGPGLHLALRASTDNVGDANLLPTTVEEGKGLLGKTIKTKRHIAVDSSSKFSSSDYREFKEKYKCENLVAYPIFATKGAKALLIVGSNAKNFTYTSDDIDVIRVFVEQIAIAIENDILIKKAEKLQIKDELTGLFNKTYMLGRLDEEIKRSVVSQRPCSFILADLDNYKDYRKSSGQPQTESVLKKIAEIIDGFSKPVGRVGRMAEDTYGLILPEANKKEAIEIAEKIRKAVEKLNLSAGKDSKLTVSSGVSENPLDGGSADEIYERAQGALRNAKKAGKNKVVSRGV